MEIGDKLECTHSCDDLYTVGMVYKIEFFDSCGNPCLRDNYGNITEMVGQPLNGVLWKFKEVC